ncbi:MAG: ATP-binding protein [Prevotellaceae bacterium]|nr:ATP-binding protein [Prevotellaceae bacterium]
MATIIIKNVGPVKEAHFTLNKINVFMGPQCSGKSTIAKIISYCQWVEKRRMLDGEYKEDVRKQLLGFHHLNESYFDENSYFEYDSDFINIRYEGTKLEEKISIKEEEIFNYKKTKNIYIPAERNFVSVIPNLRKYNETNDNIMNLIYDWFTAKEYFSKEYPLSILNFGINYYQKDADSDVLVLNDVKKEIPLNTGSSSLQSVTPLITIVEYLSTILYGEEHSLSVKENKELYRLHRIKYGSERGVGTVDFRNQREKYFKTQFIIEEPEQNLFPETQRDLVYYLLEKLQSEKEHSLTITTHSPYILYALNNCMLGGLINKQIKDKEIKHEFLSNKYLSNNSWIDPQLISMWEIKEGKIRGIQDKDGILSENYFDKKMTEITDEYFQMLNYYNDEK